MHKQDFWKSLGNRLNFRQFYQTPPIVFDSKIFLNNTTQFPRIKQPLINLIIDRFALEVGGQLFVAYVREKEAAWREYQDAISDGKTAGKG